MDPDSNLKEQLELSSSLLCCEEGADIYSEALRLADLVEALDEWIKKGGFLPSAWSKKK
jgi:hypothetical protein